MVNSIISSYALSINLYLGVHFADFGAFDHMTDYMEWFSIFIAIANHIHIWMTKKGDIKILLDIDRKQVKNILQLVMLPSLHGSIYNIFCRNYCIAYLFCSFCQA